MNNTPTLYVIAGCNGAGKSIFSNAVIPKNLISFDYDIRFLKIYKTLFDSELRDRMAHNMARKQLEEAVKDALEKKEDFCYETNFNSTPLYWVNIFKKEGFRIELFYFCLDSINEATKRVQIRVEAGGHFVPANEIEQRFHQGYENLNRHFHLFDTVHLLNSSRFGKEPEYILQLRNDKVDILIEFPDFLKQLLPTIYLQIQNSTKFL